MNTFAKASAYQNAVIVEPELITWNGGLDPVAIANEVRRIGIVVLPNFFGSDEVAKLNVEFDIMLQLHRSGNGPFVTDEHNNFMNVRVIRDMLEEPNFFSLMKAFSASFMKDVATAFFGNDAFRLNGEIFLSEHFEGPARFDTPPFALHFDKRQVLKFFVYLTDTDESNGAMRASPGSNDINRELREEAMKTNRIRDINNVLSDEYVPSLPIIGSAGTMFIFDTDMAHGASRVQPGKIRKTVRGHTHSLKMLEKIRLDVHQ